MTVLANSLSSANSIKLNLLKNSTLLSFDPITFLVLLGLFILKGELDCSLEIE